MFYKVPSNQIKCLIFNCWQKRSTKMYFHCIFVPTLKLWQKCYGASERIPLDCYDYQSTCGARQTLHKAGFKSKIQEGVSFASTTTCSYTHIYGWLSLTKHWKESLTTFSDSCGSPQLFVILPVTFATQMVMLVLNFQYEYFTFMTKFLAALGNRLIEWLIVQKDGRSNKRTFYMITSTLPEQASRMLC